MNTAGMYKTLSSIRFRLALFIGLVTTLGVLLILVFTMLSTQPEGVNPEEISESTLQEQVKANLLQQTQVNAKVYDLAFQQIVRETERLASYAAGLFDNPAAFNPAEFWTTDEHLTQQSEGQLKNPEADVSSVFVPNFLELTDELKQEIELSAYLDLVFPDIYQNNPGIEAIYFATPSEVVRYYPNINLGSVIPADFQVTQRVWYRGSLPEANPERRTWWTPVYTQDAGSRAVTTVASPVYDQVGELVGVVGVDVSLASLKSEIESAQVLETGYAFLIDKEGKSIALGERGALDIMGYLPSDSLAGMNLTSTLTDFSPIIEKMVAGESGLESVTVAGKQLLVAYAPLESTGWSQGSVIAADDVFNMTALFMTEFESNTRGLIFEKVIPISAIILFLIIAAGWWITYRMTRPIQTLAVAVGEIRRGNWEINLPGHDKDEIGVLTLALKESAHRMQDAYMQLEERLAEQTQALDRRSGQIQTIAQVAREAVATQELDVLLHQATRLICERFAYDYAGIYLLDETREHAHLRAATGKTGQNLLAKSHILSMGQGGTVGFVAETNLARVVADSKDDPLAAENLILEETRSQLGLPLSAGEVAIGVLDIQSSRVSAFKQEDIAIVQVLADQLAVAAQNAHLLEVAQENLQQLQVLYGHYNQEAWESLESARNVIGYQIDPNGMHPVTKWANGKNGKTAFAADQPPINQPLEVHGRTIGYLEIWPEGEELSEEEANFIKAVTERISLALESARLFEETRTLAFREETLNEMVANFNQSLDFNTLVDSALTQLWQMPNVSEVSIHIGPPDAFSEAASIPVARE